MKLTWLGHSCFKVESEGYAIILDPYEDGSVKGYLPVREEADLVLCSHEHGDHSGRSAVTLREGGHSPFTVTEIHTYHDDKEGTLRGTNTIRILDDGKYRIAHFGDLGCELAPEQLEQLRGLDAALIPVGGFFTIDAVQAKKLADQIQPKTVIPMHYRSGDFGYDVIGPVEAFTELCDNVKVSSGSVYEVTGDAQGETLVLQPQNKES